MPLAREVFDQLIGIETERAFRPAVKPAIALEIAIEPVFRDERFVDRELRHAAARAIQLGNECQALLLLAVSPDGSRPFEGNSIGHGYYRSKKDLGDLQD